MQVFAKCDDFMSALMQRLQQDIPQFKLKRRVRVTSSTIEDGQSVCVTVTGLDNHKDQPYSFIKVSCFWCQVDCKIIPTLCVFSLRELMLVEQPQGKSL